MRTAAIIGGGIAGLATAAGLTQRGWRVQVFEQAATFGAVGAGISIWGNALRALDALGLGDEVRAVGASPGIGGFRDGRGDWIMRGSGEPDEVLVLHRADLLEILLAAVPAECLHVGARLDPAVFDQTEVDRMLGEVDLLVGADGARSGVREAFWPDAKPLRYVGNTAWRFTLPAAGIAPFDGCETWRDGRVFGVFPMGDDQIYCYASARAAEGVRTDELTELRWLFGAWPDPIPQILAAADPAAVLRHDVYTLPPLHTFVRGKVVLIGDAAHAMAPYLGQGGCQAIEDAVSLAILASGPDLAAALREYDRMRRPRAQRVAERSLGVARMAHLSPPPLAALRNSALRLLPSSLMRRSMTRMLDSPLPAEPATSS
jgi:2-polyprenyl-6-methoxyphenol hydroxylase-like FAD-dependent oxidoreductase